MDSPGWTTDPARLAQVSPAPPARRLQSFEASPIWMATVALTRGAELAVGPLRVRAGRGKIVTTREGIITVRDGFPDEAAEELLELARGMGPAGEAELYLAIADACPDLIPVPLTEGERDALIRSRDVARARVQAAQRAILAACKRSDGDATHADAERALRAATVDLRAAEETESEALGYGRRAQAIAVALHDRETARRRVDLDTIPDTEPAPATQRTIRREKC